MDKIISLKKNTDIRRTFYKGKFINNKNIVVYALKARKSGNFLAISVSKKSGNAVCRVRIKRIIRAAYRESENKNLLNGYNIVIVGKKTAINYKSTQIKRELENCFYRLNKKINVQKKDHKYEKSRSFYHKRI